jgi:phytoene dehydrogenase-like protein
LIIEADSRPGGRLKTDELQGFRMDRGFQAYFSAYPNAGLELDLQALNLRPFQPGALFWDGKRMKEFHRDNIVEMGIACFTGKTLVPIGDLVRTMEWDRELKQTLTNDIWKAEDKPVAEMLKEERFSAAFLENFVRPFFGGIFLDRSLDVSANMFKFIWKMISVGNVSVPALGMEEIPRQIAAQLPNELFRFNTRVDQLVKTGSAVTGVRLTTGEEIEAQAVVVAVDAPEAQRLTGVKTPGGARSATTIYFDADESPTEDAILVVNGTSMGQVNHLVDVTKASKERAPRGHRLIAATIIGVPSQADAALAKNVRYEISQWLPKAGATKWRPLKVDRLPYAQLPTPPGFRNAAPPTNAGDGLFLAGEFTHYAGVDGACLSGRTCAESIIQAQGEAAA